MAWVSGNIPKFGAALAELLKRKVSLRTVMSRVLACGTRGSGFDSRPECSEIGYLLLPSRDMAEIPLKRRKSSIQPTKAYQNLNTWLLRPVTQLKSLNVTCICVRVASLWQTLTPYYSFDLCPTSNPNALFSVGKGWGHCFSFASSNLMSHLSLFYTCNKECTIAISRFPLMLSYVYTSTEYFIVCWQQFVLNLSISKSIR